MDNLTHTLVGMAVGEAGLRRGSRLATATLVIGANLPDVDALIYLFGTGTDALAFRRGWTHGILAMVVLPALLTGAMLLFDRWRRRRRPGLPAATVAGLLPLATIAVWSHPLLDWLNVYGVRLLMPFSERWFYGDALFIVDPWVWLVLGGTVVWSRRRRGPRAGRPARLGGLLVIGYLALMIVSSRIGRRIVEAEGTGIATAGVVAPLPVIPHVRDVVRRLSGEYETGRLAFGWPSRYAATERIPIGNRLPGVAAAAATEPGRAFLSWARFPRYQVTPVGDSLLVRLSDMRYGTGREASFAMVEVMVGRGDR